MAPKKVVQDIIPSSRRSIRSVAVRPKILKVENVEKVEEFSKKTKDEEIEEIFTKKIQKRKSTVNNINKPAGRSSKFLITFGIIFICILIIGISLSLIYTKGIITITPITFNLNIDGNFTAKKDAVSIDQLKYEIVTVSADSHKTIPAINGPLVQTKATGTVILFNTTNLAQKLVAGTKISNTNGLVYRTNNTVTIPPKKTNLGSISVVVIADKTGANYNAKLADLSGDFKIVEYKNTAKYALFYGRSKTDISGGYIGYKKIISPDLQKSTELSLQAELKAKLLAQVAPIIPKDYVLFDNANVVEYKNSEPTTVATGTADISVHGTMSGIIFNKNTLLKYIASKELKLFTTSTYDIKGIEDLKFTLNNSKDFSIAKNTLLIFSLKGPVALTGTFSEDSLRKQLMGVKLTNSNLIFKDYPSISNAYARITPFWMRSFPNSIDNIIIEYKYK